MGANLKIETGIKEFVLNGEVSVFFNPTDENFIAKTYKAFDELDDKQAEYIDKIRDADAKELIAFMKKVDEEMRGILVDLFGKDVVTPLIGDMNVYALADGMPIWANLMLAIIDVIDAEEKTQTKLQKARIAKYTAKYEAQDHQKKKAKKK